MKKITLLTLSIIFFFDTSICFSQRVSTSDSTLLKIEANHENLLKRVIEIEKVANKAQVDNNNLSVIADLIISYSSYISLFIAFGLAVATIFTGFQLYDIRKAREEFNGIISDMKSSYKKQNKDFNKIKEQFELEKKKSLELLFPLIEGQIHFTNGDYTKALKLFTEANIIEPDHPKILKPLYWLISNTGRLEEAIIKLERLHKDKPDSKVITNRLAEAYRRNKDYDKAEFTVKDLAIVEKYPQSLYEYGAILQGKQKYIDAEKYFVESNRYYLVEDGVERFWLYLSIALSQFINKKNENSFLNAKKAVFLCKKSLLKTPNNSHCFVSLSIAQILVNINDTEAVKNLKKAIINNLPIGLTESAIEKLNLIEISQKSTVTEKLREILNHHINNMNNDEYVGEDL